MLVIFAIWLFTLIMGIEFIEEPPKKVGDISRDNKVEDLFANIGYTAEFGVDPMYVHMGQEDGHAVLANILERAQPKDVIDFEAMRAMLYNVSEGLPEGVRKSYRRGVDLYLERMLKIGEQAANSQYK